MAKMYLGENLISKIYGSGASSVANANAPKYINKRGVLYRQIFEDDFDKPDIDRNVWNSDYRSAHYEPWYVCGSDYYVKDSILNLRVRTNKRTLDSASWPAAASGIQSVQSSSPNAKHDFRPFYGFVSQEGYYELRCRMYADLEATLDGSHFAWWMTGVDEDNGKNCEYDMIEHFGNAPTVANLNVYANSDTELSTSTRKAYTANFDIGVDWHTWGFLWEEDHLTVWLDDVQILSMDVTTPRYPMMQWITAYRSLGERVGYWAGEYDPNQPDMISQIDYLRIYKKADVVSESVTIVSYDPISIELTAGEYTINSTSGRLTDVPLHCYVYWSDGSRTEHIVQYEALTHNQISILDKGGTFEMQGIAMGIGISIVAIITVTI